MIRKVWLSERIPPDSDGLRVKAQPSPDDRIREKLPHQLSPARHRMGATIDSASPLRGYLMRKPAEINLHTPV
jgi:hypothetical protein